MTNDKPARLGEPVAPPHRDLSAVFNPALRTTLPARDKTAKPPPTVAAETEDTSTPPPATGKRTRPAAGNRSSAADDHLTSGRVVYLTEPVRDALGVACAQQHKTRTVVALEAIEATYEDLPALIAQDLAPTVVKGKLWESVVAPSRRDQPPKRQVYISPTHAQVKIINALIEQSGARDRSHLVNVAIAAHLGLAPLTNTGSDDQEGT